MPTPVRLAPVLALLILSSANFATADPPGEQLPGGKVIVLSGNTLELIDPATLKTTASLALGVNEGFAGVTRDGKTAFAVMRAPNEARSAWVVSSASTVELPALRLKKALAKPFDKTLGEARSVVPCGDAGRILVTYADGTIAAWNTETEEQEWSIKDGGTVRVVSDDGFVVEDGRKATLRSLESGESLSAWKIPNMCAVFAAWLDDEGNPMVLLEHSNIGADDEFWVCAFGKDEPVKKFPAPLHLETTFSSRLDARTGRMVLRRISGATLKLFEFDRATGDITEFALTNEGVDKIHSAVPLAKDGMYLGWTSEKIVRFSVRGIKK